MKNKGFTLIELLAVIVILAIIALIATPIILNIINDSKEESNKRSIDMYAKAIKNAIAVDQLDGTIGLIGTFNTTTLEEKLNVEYDGELVSCDIIKIYENGSIYLSDCNINGKTINYEYGKLPTYKNGEVVYFNVETGKSCTNYHIDNSKTGYNGYTNKDSSKNEIQKLETQNGCLKFYAFNDNGGKVLNLLLDHNTTVSSFWTNSSTSTNVEGPIDVLTSLYNDTKEWQGTNVPDDYEVSYGAGYANYKIDYDNNLTPYKARIIEANEVAEIIGFENFDAKSSSSIYFHDKSSDSSTGAGSVCATLEGGCVYGWLYDRTGNPCQHNGCFNDGDWGLPAQGYWTSDAVTTYSNLTIWIVSYSGSLYGNIDQYTIVNNAYTGVRPVIEVSKSNL